jgi:LmbE family N-acetylglucosaminyl deacetylase
MTVSPPEKPYIPERVLVITAHPDDIEFTCAGTVALWVSAGAVARYVLCTSGQVGVKDPSLTVEEVAAFREREQVAAAKKIGVEDVVFLGHMDGVLENTLDLRRELVRQIRQFRPEVVIATSHPHRLFVPTNNYINHPDHRAAAAAALDAVFPAAGMPHVFQDLEAEGLTAHETRRVYVVDYDEPSRFVDITEVMDRKLASLHEHTSQIKEMGDWDPDDFIRKRSAELVAENGVEGATYVEAFRVIKLKSREDWERCKGHVLPEDCPDQPYTDADTGH